MSRLNETELAASEVVANAAMNRGRSLTGVNSYARELRLDVGEWLRPRLDGGRSVTWLDLCCGEGRALDEAERILAGETEGARLELIGVDLVPPQPSKRLTNVQLVSASLHAWSPPHPCDLVTCVHGLHYIGDKLGLLERIATWLRPDGLFIGNLDLADVRAPDGSRLTRRVMPALRAAGATYSASTRVLRMTGERRVKFGQRFLGADDAAGPNYTKQPAVTSYYSPA